jgi:hypothetical protein
MPDPSPAGKTLWEMFKERLHRNGANISFYNPLDLRVGSMVPLSKNKPELTGIDFAVTEIREYNRRIGNQEFRFTDYVLTGTNTKTFNPDDAVIARLRAVPNQVGSRDVLLLRLSDELAFDQGFLDVVKDTTGIFEVTDDATGEKERYSRINDVRDPYEAAVLILTATNDDGTAPPGKVASLRLEYWDYWRDVGIGDGRTTKKQFLFVEMNSDTGWFQIWQGEEYFI